MDNNTKKQKLVLIPGMAGDQNFFRHITDYLTDDAEIIVPVIARCKSRDEMVEAVISSVDGKFALAGTSMGGWVAFSVIKKVPERVTKFAAIATWARPIPQIETEQKKLLEKLKRGEYKDIINRFYELSPDSQESRTEISLSSETKNTKFINPRVVAFHMNAYLNDFDSRHLLNKIKCPTIVIAGGRDEIFNVAEHEFICSSIKGAKLAVIDDSGHFIAKEQPQALATLLRYWLRYF